MTVYRLSSTGVNRGHTGTVRRGLKATGDMSRFNTVHPGSPRFSTVPPRFYPGSSRFIPDHRTGMDWAQALEVWPLNPLKCLKYKITLALRSYCYVHYRKPLFRPNRNSSACGLGPQTGTVRTQLYGNYAKNTYIWSTIKK